MIWVTYYKIHYSEFKLVKFNENLKGLMWKATRNENFSNFTFSIDVHILMHWISKVVVKILFQLKSGTNSVIEFDFIFADQKLKEIAKFLLFKRYLFHPEENQNYKFYCKYERIEEN